MALDLANLYCAWAGCRNLVTHVSIQSDQSAMLFSSAAGLVCERHARELEPFGGLSMPISVFATTVAEWHEGGGNG